MRSRDRFPPGPVLLSLLVAGCINVATVEITPLTPSPDSLTIPEPVKAHLRDGSTVVYRYGLTMLRDTLRGTGVSYGLTLRDSTPAEAVPFDQVVTLEQFDTRIEAGATAGYSLIATAMTVGLLVAGISAAARFMSGNGN